MESSEHFGPEIKTKNLRNDFTNWAVILFYTIPITVDAAQADLCRNMKSERQAKMVPRWRSRRCGGSPGQDGMTPVLYYLFQTVWLHVGGHFRLNTRRGLNPASVQTLSFCSSSWSFSFPHTHISTSTPLNTKQSRLTLSPSLYLPPTNYTVSPRHWSTSIAANTRHELAFG